MITLYTLHCPKCSVLQKKLEAANVDFSIVEDENAVIAKGEANGIMSLPILEVDEEVMDFTRAVKWLAEKEA